MQSHRFIFAAQAKGMAHHTQMFSALEVEEKMILIVDIFHQLNEMLLINMPMKKKD
jgi:hypothetical protein